MNNIKESIKELGAGYAIGAANIIPGVSGGTFLLIFGLYEKVISILNGLGGSEGKRLLKELFSFLKAPFNSEVRNNFIKLLSEKGIFFLFKLMFGALLAIGTLSTLMEYLLEKHHTNTYALFFGLIAASIFVPIKLFKSKKLYHLLPFIIGLGVTFYVADSVNPYDKAIVKSERYEKRYETQQSGTEITESSQRFQFIGHYTPSQYLFITLSGAIAISAMVLPGLSGSLVLILLGQYVVVLSAISGFLKDQILDHGLLLGCMTIGMALGLLVFVKLINFVFAKYHDGTMAFLTGLIAGSLFALWPFKGVGIIENHYVKVNGSIELIKNSSIYTNENIWAKSTNELLIALAFIVLGIIIMIPFLKNEKAEA